ncbi:MAG: DNA mismatch repair protein MutS [Sphingomonas sp.]|nr:MAG: DNA mismatch repair protein MutS [Sphingomonas sp.]
MATVTPLPPAPRAAIAAAPASHAKHAGAAAPRTAVPTPPPVKLQAPGTTLDASWDRKLMRGSVEPDATVDLHGHTLTSAYTMLDQALERSRLRGDRVILLITGKPPRRDSERPHARGAIRAAVGDWLHASRHAGAIAAVRGASPRHGGAGALYIILRRARSGPKS